MALVVSHAVVQSQCTSNGACEALEFKEHEATSTSLLQVVKAMTLGNDRIKKQPNVVGVEEMADTAQTPTRLASGLNVEEIVDYSLAHADMASGAAPTDIKKGIKFDTEIHTPSFGGKGAQKNDHYNKDDTMPIFKDGADTIGKKAYLHEQKGKVQKGSPTDIADQVTIEKNERHGDGVYLPYLPNHVTIAFERHFGTSKWLGSGPFNGCHMAFFKIKENDEWKLGIAHIPKPDQEGTSDAQWKAFKKLDNVEVVHDDFKVKMPDPDKNSATYLFANIDKGKFKSYTWVNVHINGADSNDVFEVKTTDGPPKAA